MIIHHLITVYMMRIKLGIKRQLDLQHRIVTVDELAAAQKIIIQMNIQMCNLFVVEVPFFARKSHEFSMLLDRSS